MLNPSLRSALLQKMVSFIQRPLIPPNFDFVLAHQRLADPVNDQDLSALGQQVKILQAEIAATRGISFDFQGKKIRLYAGDQAFKFQELDLYVRGLHHAYAAIKIAQLEKLPLNPARINEYLQKFTRQYQEIRSQGTPESFAQAKQATLNFMGILAQEVALARLNAFPAPAQQAQTTESQSPSEVAYKKAFSDLKKATELYNTIESPEEVICTYTTADTAQGLQYTIQWSERLQFENNLVFNELVQLERDKRRGRVISPGDRISQTQIEEDAANRHFWYRHNYHRNGKNHGLWFVKFMQENFDAFMRASPPSSTRDLPNPANAWQETIFHLDSEGKLLSSDTATRMAISSPFHIPSKAARVQMAQESTHKLLSDQRLQQTAAEYIERWGPLLAGSRTITVPILHQTLVAPAFFYGADRDMIAVKSQANVKIRERLKEKEYLINGKKVRFQLLETNNCINIWHPLINPRNNDIEHAELLINHTAVLVKNFRNVVAKHKNSNFDYHAQRADGIDRVLGYLQNRQRSWLLMGPLSHQNPTKKQMAAIQQICADLFAGNYTAYGLTPSQQKDLSLTIQAAINLKKINHETYLGYYKRKLNNFLRPKEFSLLTPITSLLSLPVYAGRYLVNTIARAMSHIKSPNGQPSWKAVFLPTLFGYKNKHTFKSSYEEILTGKLGMIFGGCKSALDRAGEVRINKNAMVDQFYQSGNLIDFYQSDEQYYQYLTYVSHYERTGHQNQVAANRHGSHARKMWETLNHYYIEVLSVAQRKIEKINAGFREIKAIPTGARKQAMLRQYQSTLPATAPKGMPSSNSSIEPRLSVGTEVKQGRKPLISAKVLPTEKDLMPHQSVILSGGARAKNKSSKVSVKSTKKIFSGTISRKGKPPRKAH